MPLAPALPLAETSYLSVRFDGTIASAIDVLSAIDAGLTQGLLIRGNINGSREGETVNYWIALQPSLNGEPIGNELRVDPGTWIVVASTGMVRIRKMTDQEYAAEFQTNQ